MKVRIAANDVAAYPDVMVIRGERQFYDDRRDVVTNPTLIVEVLSDSTEAYDRGDKFRHYRSIASLRAYLDALIKLAHRQRRDDVSDQVRRGLTPWRRALHDGHSPRPLHEKRPCGTIKHYSEAI